MPRSRGGGRTTSGSSSHPRGLRVLGLIQLGGGTSSRVEARVVWKLEQLQQVVGSDQRRAVSVLRQRIQVDTQPHPEQCDPDGRSRGQRAWRRRVATSGNAASVHRRARARTSFRGRRPAVAVGRSRNGAPVVGTRRLDQSSSAAEISTPTMFRFRSTGPGATTWGGGALWLRRVTVGCGATRWSGTYGMW